MTKVYDTTRWAELQAVVREYGPQLGAWWRSQRAR